MNDRPLDDRVEIPPSGLASSRIVADQIVEFLVEYSPKNFSSKDQDQPNRLAGPRRHPRPSVKLNSRCSSVAYS